MIESVVFDVKKALSENVPVLVTADPGSGKTTILPPLLLKEPWLAGRTIVLLEPRRLAAKSAASRMASLHGERPGETFGWKIAHETKISTQTRLQVVTEGVLTRWIQSDPELTGVGLVLFDEFHERTLHGDLGLALTLDVRRSLRPDLRLGILSATLDADELLARVPGAKAIHASGKVFPVVTEYRPPAAGESVKDAAARTVLDAWSSVKGTILVFLPGWSELQRVRDLLNEAAREKNEFVAILHGSLSVDDQQAVLAPLPLGQRKTILSTSIAETSLTIEGVELVIDAGESRLVRFDQRRGLDRLVTERVSLASADQRRGRAGRTGPGFCWRLWKSSEVLNKHTDPEILRADLTGTVLESAAWGAALPSDLPWVTTPLNASWNAAKLVLTALNAFDAQGHVTPLGRQLSTSGVGPRLGSLLVDAEDLVLAAACAAILAERDPLASERDPDLALRLHPLLNGESSGPWRSIRDRQQQLLQRFAAGKESLQPEWRGRLGSLLAKGFPDRLAVQVAFDQGIGRFQMESGRVVRVTGALTSSVWIVVLDADGGETVGSVSLAAAISSAEAQVCLALRQVSVRRVAWNGWRPRAFRLRVVGALVLEQTGIALAEAADELRCSAQELWNQRSADERPWGAASRNWIRRLKLLGFAEPTFDELWPALETGSGDPFSETKLFDALMAAFSWEIRQRVEREAPAFVVLPTGQRRSLDYREDGTVVLEVRIQEVFGWTASPQSAGKPVILHLLSPAHRPLQVTQDLASFWRVTYPQVRKEMRGRYPRHPWPENPWAAEPTARAKPRGT